MVLVFVDGLRADSPGGSGAAAAFFEAADLPAGMEFDAAYAQAPKPFLSMGAILSGRYPTSLPLCGPLSAGTSVAAQPWCMHIPERVPTLPEILENYEYQTLLIADSIPGDPVLGKEFEAWQSYGQPTASDPPYWDEVQERAASWWSETEGPRLLVVVSGALSLEQKSMVKTEVGLTATVQVNDENRGALQQTAEQIYSRLASESGASVSSLLSALPEGDRPRISLVAGASGTSLVESSPFPDQPVPALSSGLLLDRTLRVPLHISGAGIEAGRVSDPVEMLDILPTLLNRAGATLPAGIPGSDLLGDQPESDPVAYAQFGDMRAIRMGPYLLTWRAFVHGASTLDPRVSDGIGQGMQNMHRLFLHRVTDDASQQIELKESHTDVVRALLIELYRREMRLAAPPPELMTADRIKELQLSASEGYW
jgi:arylsulfatase A-like enzyme